VHQLFWRVRQRGSFRGKTPAIKGPEPIVEPIVHPPTELDHTLSHPLGTRFRLWR